MYVVYLWFLWIDNCSEWEFYTIQLRILSSDMLKLTLDYYVEHPESIYYSKQYFPL